MAHQPGERSPVVARWWEVVPRFGAKELQPPFDPAEEPVGVGEEGERLGRNHAEVVEGHEAGERLGRLQPRIGRAMDEL